MNGPYVIRSSATGGYLGQAGRIVFRKNQARVWSLRERADRAFLGEQRRFDSVIGATNPLGWEVLPKSEAVDLSI